MTEHKSFKRKVRARMEKTGERYGAARRRLLTAPAQPAQPEPEPWHGEPPADDKAVRGATGRGWDEWCALLDEWGARDRTHTEVARHVADEYGVDGWWAQCVTVGYERIRGTRALYQRSDGKFEASVTKTVAAPVEVVYDAIAGEAGRAAWLPGAEVSMRTATRPKLVRWDWPDGSRVVFYLMPKGEAKTTVSMAIQKLADGEAVVAAKSFWKDRLEALAASLAG